MEIVLAALPPDSTIIITPAISAVAGRQAVAFRLPDDDDLSNNFVRFECVVGPVARELLISEFLSNADSLGCEWIELQSVVDYDLPLQDWVLEIEGKPSPLDSTCRVEPGEKIVVCADSICFRAAVPDANCNLLQPEMWRALDNLQGTIALRMQLGAISDSIEYRGAIEPGRSWERDFDSTDAAFASLFYRSTAISGSTPCHENSVRPAPVVFDIGFVGASLSLAKDSIDNSKIRAEFRLVNLGCRDSAPVAIQVFDDSNRDGNAGSSELVLTHNIDPIPKGDSVTVSITLPVATGRKHYIFALADDEVLSNNTASGMITVGELTQELIITEFLADPAGSLETEWIEIKNASAFPVDLHGWRVGELTNPERRRNGSCLGTR